MAYGQYLAAVPTQRLLDFRTTIARLRQEGMEEILKTTWLEVDKIVLTSHYFASAGTPDPVLTEVIVELFDGGEILDNWYRHPFYPPRFHLPETVSRIYQAFALRWAFLIKQLPPAKLPDWETDFIPILDMLQHANQHQLAMLTFMEESRSDEQAAQVFYPVAPVILNKLP